MNIRKFLSAMAMASVVAAGMAGLAGQGQVRWAGRLERIERIERSRIRGMRNKVTATSTAFDYGDYRVKKVSAKELNRILFGERSLPMVVDFYATWCGPCILLAQVLEQLAVEYANEVTFVKVDTDEEYELAHQMEIRGLPTMVFVSKDREKAAIRTEGLLPIQVIRDIIRKEL